MELSLETSKLLVGAKVGIAVPPPVGERVSLLVDEGLVVGDSVMTWSVALDDDGAVVGTSVVLDTVGDAVSLELLVGDRVVAFAESTVGLAVSLLATGLIVGDSVMT